MLIYTKTGEYFMHSTTKNALETLLGQFADGRYQINTLLPSERRLCNELGVGRGAVRAIFDELCARGILCGQPGRGMRVAALPEKKFRRFLVFKHPGDGPEIARVFDGLSAGADECGAEMGFLSGSLNHMADVLRSRTKYQGAVVIEQFDETVLQALWNESIPVVIANLERGGNFPGTRVDYRDIGRRAGRIFFEAGHRKIGFLSGNTSVFIYQEMLAGLKGALAEDDIALNPEWVIQKYGSFDVHEELTALLSQPEHPSAFLAGRDYRAMELYRCCRELNLRIPEDISVLSFDNLTWRESEKYGLSSFEEPAFELGREAVHMLGEWIGSAERPGPRKLSVSLFDRGSVGVLVQ